MYLRRLELHGFKTFADRTELEFTPGITAIVGPNGSGKSNVFDGIRWVLGEMGYRSLRSGRMDDIIFAGSEFRRAMGQAIVSLTINNDSGVLPIDFTEVTVTRRANRGGEGECFLNDTACRLRDIQMLFLGTGLGGRSYSLIGQGQVDSVLNAGPEERRVLLEEAAGLARYKRRRREAERRLGHAAANLLRVQDVLAELTTQMEQLREQAEAATAYQAYTTEVRQLEMALQVDEARRIISNLKRIATQAESVRQQLHTTAATATEVGQKIDRNRARAVEVATAWEEAQRTLLQVVEGLAGRESAMQILHERVRTTTAQRERIAADVQRLESRLAQVDEALTALREQAELLGNRRDDLLDQLRKSEEAQDSALSTAGRVDERLAAARGELADLTAARTRTLHDLARFDTRLGALADQLTVLNTKDEVLAQAAGQTQTRIGELEAAIAQLQREHDEVHARLAEVQQQRQEIEATIARLDEELRQLRADRQVVASTLVFLEDMHKQLAGYEQGVREILLAKREHPEQFTGIRYPVVELLKVAPAHRNAIEAALGRRLFSLVADTIEDVKRGVAYLRGNGQGSATFLPEDLITKRQTPPIPADADVVGRAVDLVQLTNGANEVVDALLGDVVVVTNLDAAVALRREGYPGRIVTVDGELLSPDGVVSVRGKTNDQTLLGRAEQIEALRARLGSLDQRETELTARLAAYQVQRDTLDQHTAQAQNVSLRCQQAISEQHTALTVVQAEAGRLPADREEVETARSQVVAERAVQEAEAGRLREDEAVIARTIGEREETIAALEAELHAARDAAQAAAAQLTEVRVQLAEISGTLEALETRIDEHVNDGAELTQRVNHLQGEIAVLDGERHLLEHSLEEARKAHQTLAKQQDATRTHLAALEAERSSLQQTLTELEASWRHVQDSLREVEDQVHRLEVRHAQVEAELQAARRRISEEFGVGWDDVREVRLPASRDEALGRIEALRGLIAVLGPVNLRAVEEHRAVAARVETLRGQADDLERARAALGLLIQRLDEVLRVRFAETFAAVNEEFNRLFVRLFAGGRARLLLVEGEPGPSTALRAGTEPGIEIEAQLPGKKMRSLPALSGGERVLVALSLIFAMLRVHPSPFCIFDEVEAALDDANTKKFTTLLRELAEKTQVLIITHNKGTMEVADVLYGVTMESPAVSKIISMRLTRTGEREPVAVP